MQTFLLLVMTMSVAINSEKYVTVEAKSQATSVENGKPFILLLAMKSLNGIHVNVQPPFSIKPLVENPGSANGSTTLKLKAIPKKGDYVDLSKHIKVECELTGINPGLHNVRFIVGYTFCSEKEGWCRMGSDTVSVTVNMKK